jgi:hypothetical protein
MLRHIEDKRACPHCGRKLHRQRYMMSRDSENIVLSPQVIVLIVCFLAALTVFSQLGS